MENTISPVSISASEAYSVTTLLATPSSSGKIDGKKTGAVVKVPALIGKTIVQVYLEAIVDLEEPALEITNIRHDLNMTGCEFMQVESAISGKLIMSGYIRQNIDYLAARKSDDGSTGFNSKRTGMNIPFKCFTKLQLSSEPDIPVNSFQTNENSAVSPLIANNTYYSNSSEDLNFEVAETKIHQVNVKRNVENIAINNYNEEVFSSFSINMAVDVVLLIMQNQFVEIPASSNSSSNNNKSSNSKDSGNGNKGSQKSSSKSSKYAWIRNFKFPGSMFKR